jgi:DNA-binding response OmpR family regulator
VHQKFSAPKSSSTGSASLSSYGVLVWTLCQDTEATSAIGNELNGKAEFEISERVDDLLHLDASPGHLPPMMLIDLDLVEHESLTHTEPLSRLFRSSQVIVMASDRSVHRVDWSLRQGAIDFMLKPLRREEVQVRLSSALNTVLSTRAAQNAKVAPWDLLNQFGDMLTPTEQKILWVFLKHSGHRVSRTELVEAVWRHSRVHPKTLDVHIFNLRKKISNYGYYITYGGIVGTFLLTTRESSPKRPL